MPSVGEGGRAARNKEFYVWKLGQYIESGRIRYSAGMQGKGGERGRGRRKYSVANPLSHKILMHVQSPSF